MENDRLRADLAYTQIGPQQPTPPAPAQPRHPPPAAKPAVKRRRQKSAVPAAVDEAATAAAVPAGEDAVKLGPDQAAGETLAPALFAWGAGPCPLRFPPPDRDRVL